MATSAQKRLEELGRGPVGWLLVKLSWPALVSMTLNSLYQVVDRFYIGHGCGEDAMAGVSLTLPVMLTLVAFGVWVGAGHSSLLALKLGEGDRVASEKVLGQLIALKTTMFLLLTPLAYLLMNPVLDLCGGADITPKALELSKVYLRIVLIPQVFAHLAFGLSGQMRSEGAAMMSMVCMIVGCLTNMILDPVFIFDSIEVPFLGWKIPCLGMGVAGAAWSTNVAMTAAFVTAIAYYLSGHSAVRLRWSRIRIHWTLAKRALSIGASPFLQHLLSAVIGFSFTKALAMWSATPKDGMLQVAAFGIYHATLMLFFMPVMGVQQGISPIMGYNWGARNYQRVRKSLKIGLWLTTLIVVVATLAFMFFPEPVAKAFGAKGELVKVSARVLWISNCFLWTIGINVVATTYFQSIGKPRMAIILSTLRQGVCLLPCIWLLPCVMEDHILAIWLAMPISDIVCQLATLPPLMAHLRFLRSADRIVRKYRRNFVPAMIRD